MARWVGTSRDDGVDRMLALLDLEWMTPARKRWDFYSRRHPQYYGLVTEPVRPRP